MAEMRIAVVGAGIIGRTHIATIEKIEGFTLAAVVDPIPQGGELASRHGAPFFADVEEMIGSIDIDGAIVATPNETHVEISTALMEAGVPVLLEKPIANTVAEARVLLEVERRTGRPLLVGHHRRHNPIIKAAKRAINGGVIGDLVTASVVSSLMKPAEYFGPAWRRRPGVGGPLLINMIHEIDLMRHLFGDVVSVAALSSNAIRGFEVEDTAAAILKFERAGMATLTVSDTAVGPWAWDLSSGENLERFPAHKVQSHFLCGTEGGLSLPDLSLWSHKSEKSWNFELGRKTLPFTEADAYEEQLRHFGEVIAGRAAPLVSGLDAAKDLATISAIREAAGTGTWKTVESVSDPAGTEART